jgi:hypothetical protein
MPVAWCVVRTYIMFCPEVDIVDAKDDAFVILLGFYFQI